jgi:glycosyltransferase involved in cell wall biosynthesis
MPGRVLHLIPTLGHGGAERQLAYLTRGLSDRGWEVHVASLAGGLFREPLLAGGGHLHPIRSRGSFDPMILLQIFRLIRKIEPRVVQTWLPMMDVLGGLAAHAVGAPWILSERCGAEAYDDTLRLRVRRRLGRRAQAVIANSTGGDAYWLPLVPPTTHRFVIRNALPLDEIDAAAPADPARFGWSDAPLILSIGRFNEQKNVIGVIEALERAMAVEPAVGLILGDGVQTEQAKLRIAAAGLQSSIRVPGVVDGVFSWMKHASVLVSLSRFEGMPNVVMEAMAAGCPLVVSDIRAHREILDDQCALWVSPEDPPAAADAIVSILRNPRAAGERAARARARAREWSIPRAADAYLRAYEAVAPSASG